jgi:hypothetical protein
MLPGQLELFTEEQYCSGSMGRRQRIVRLVDDDADVCTRDA